MDGEDSLLTPQEPEDFDSAAAHPSGKPTAATGAKASVTAAGLPSGSLQEVQQPASRPQPGGIQVLLMPMHRCMVVDVWCWPWGG